MTIVERAVIYRSQDHLGAVKRLVINLVDLFVATVLSVVVTVVVVLALGTERATYIVGLLCWMGVWFLYLVVLKGSRFRTLGYITCGARIVNLSGERPGYFVLSSRVGCALWSPFLADALWVASDRRKQALRDKVAHTYVIRNGAVPVGAGRVVYEVSTLPGMTLLLAEVVDEEPSVDAMPAG